MTSSLKGSDPRQGAGDALLSKEPKVPVYGGGRVSYTLEKSTEVLQWGSLRGLGVHGDGGGSTIHLESGGGD